MGMLDVDEQGYEEGSEDDHDGIDDKEERRASEKKESGLVCFHNPVFNFWIIFCIL